MCVCVRVLVCVCVCVIRQLHLLKQYSIILQILTLRESISNLVISLVEENGPGKSQVALVI